MELGNACILWGGVCREGMAMETQMELQHRLTHPKAEESVPLLQLPESTRRVTA